MTRKELIKQIIDVEMDSFFSDPLRSEDWLWFLFHDGFKGYNKMTDKELLEIYHEDFVDDDDYDENLKVLN